MIDFSEYILEEDDLEHLLHFIESEGGLTEDEFLEVLYDEGYDLRSGITL